MSAGRAAVKGTPLEGILKKYADEWLHFYPPKSLRHRPTSLRPNTTYRAGKHKYEYTTDSQGRITSASANPLLPDTSPRARHNSKTPDKQTDDHAGHIFGDRFGGSPELDNLVSQAGGVNLSKYKKLENEWADALADGKKVTVDVTIKYGADGRPTGFHVRYTIDGNPSRATIPNK